MSLLSLLYFTHSFYAGNWSSCLPGFSFRSSPSGKAEAHCSSTSTYQASFAPLQNKACANLEPPLALVVPDSEEDVKAIVHYVRRHNIPLSYVGGGHSYTCKSQIPGSLQISMRRFKSIRKREVAKGTVNAKGLEVAGTVTLGAGLLFSEVFNVLSPKDNAIAHGGCHSVGVAGFYIHGGIHAPSTRLTGLGNDTIVSIRLVTPTGQLKEVSAESTGENFTLWNAMRVAGSSFGIATFITVQYLKEPEATIYPFFTRMSTSAFSESMLKSIVKQRGNRGEDANNADLNDITLDGAGPLRFSPYAAAKQFDPDMFIWQVSVRNNNPYGGVLDVLPAQVKDSVQLARAATHLASLLPLAATPTIVPIPPVFDDLSIAYDYTGGDYVSTFMCFDAHECGDDSLKRIVRRLTDSYREHAYADAVNACWQVFSTLTSFPDKMCFEYNCPNSDLFVNVLQQMDEQNKQDCPAYVRYYNVPSFHAPNANEYFTNVDQLRRWKTDVDPHGILNSLSGV